MPWRCYCHVSGDSMRHWLVLAESACDPHVLLSMLVCAPPPWSSLPPPGEKTANKHAHIGRERGREWGGRGDLSLTGWFFRQPGCQGYAVNRCSSTQRVLAASTLSWLVRLSTDSGLADMSSSVKAKLCSAWLATGPHKQFSFVLNRSPGAHGMYVVHRRYASLTIHGWFTIWDSTGSLSGVRLLVSLVPAMILLVESCVGTIGAAAQTWLTSTVPSEVGGSFGAHSLVCILVCFSHAIQRAHVQFSALSFTN
jgi:hypothetical protein